jgi:hypothetical protein
MSIFWQMGLAMLWIFFKMIQVVFIGVVIKRSHVPFATKDLLSLLFFLRRQHAINDILDIAIEPIIFGFCTFGYLSCFHVSRNS